MTELSLDSFELMIQGIGAIFDAPTDHAHRSAMFRSQTFERRECA